MRTRKFTLLSDFGAYVVNWVEENIGCTNQRRIASIVDHSVDNMENVLHHTALALQNELQVSTVWSKKNISQHSKTLIIGVFWCEVWVYFAFYKRKQHINVIVMYRQKKMKGFHSVFSQMSEQVI
jgi:hypothetical protein